MALARVRRCGVASLLVASACAQHGASEIEAVDDTEEVVEAEIALEELRTAPPRRCAAVAGEAVPLDASDESRPTLRVETDEGVRVLPLVETTFRTDVTGTIAETTVTQVFANPLDRAISATYVFPLPDDAAVDDYWIFVDDRSIHGRMKRRAEARAIYEQAQQQGKSAGLLEQERPNVFTQSVANIPAGEAITVEMHVVQALDAERGRYELVLPTTVGPRFVPGTAIGHRGTGVQPDTDRVPDGSRISPPIATAGTPCNPVVIEVDIDAGTAIDDLRARFHDIVVEREDDRIHVGLRDGVAVADRDFELSWTAPGELARGILHLQRTAHGDYFTLTVEPPDDAAPDLLAARDVVFVLDTSGSMEGMPLQTAQRAVHRAIDQLRPTDAFTVIQFSGDTDTMPGGLVPATTENRARGHAYVETMRGGGGTMMLAGITAALGTTRRAGRIPIVVFLTDGFIGNETEIFTAIAERIGDARIFSLGVGPSVNRYLLDGMAKIGRGAAAYVGPGAAADLATSYLLERIAAPALTDLEIDWGTLAVEDVVPSKIPDVFLGQSVALFGRVTGPLQGVVTLHGRRGTEEVAIPVEVELATAIHGDGVASLWARRRIDELLLSPQALLEDELSRKRTEQQVTELALAHRVMTEFTAFVAVDERSRVAGAGQQVVVPSELPAGMSGVAVGEAFGVGGLGLVGTGRGGGGAAYGTIGLGSGAGYGRGSAGGVPGRVRMAKATVHGSLDRDLIRRVVRSHVNEVRHCYTQGLAANAGLSGRISVRFVIARDGSVASAEIAESTVADEGVESCIAHSVERWRFPAGAEVTVVYPFVLSP